VTSAVDTETFVLAIPHRFAVDPFAELVVRADGAIDDAARHSSDARLSAAITGPATDE
jgi:hypothetical protein